MYVPVLGVAEVVESFYRVYSRWWSVGAVKERGEPSSHSERYQYETVELVWEEETGVAAQSESFGSA